MVVASPMLVKLDSWAVDPLAFFSDVLTHPDGTSYGDNLDPWQVEDFRNLAKRGGNAWLERPRGHAKTLDSAAFTLHHLLTTPDARAFFGAVDKEQASLAHDSITGFIRRSPLLSSTFQIGKWEVVAPSTDARLTVLAADAPGSWGLRPSLVVCDELQAWRGGTADEFFWALYSSLGKVPGRMLVATTAGSDQRGLCWNVRSQIIDDPAWLFSRRGQCASWISPKFLAEQRRVLPPIIYKNVHLNEWTEVGTNALVSPEQWDACRKDVPRLLPESTTPTVLALDVGLKHDSTAIVVVTRDPDANNAVAVRAVAIWVPPKGGEVQLRGPGSPDEWVRKFRAEHRLTQVCVDPYQARGLAQEWTNAGIWCSDFEQGAERLRADTALVSLILERRLRHSGEPDLREHILNASAKVALGEDKLRIVKSHPKKRVDLAVALSMAAHRCLYLHGM